ncbi:hypothetical protein KKE85_01185 [Patescibacteria group bacterium]|nr:hypothetical protein [Patescibacteria group bacterium]
MQEKFQKGTTLYFAIIILSILLAAVFSLGTVVLIQLKTIKGMGDSVIAYYAADSGAETALYNGKSSPPSDISQTSIWSGGFASFETETFATGTPECINGRWYCISSVGKYQSTERRVKITR